MKRSGRAWLGRGAGVWAACACLAASGANWRGGSGRVDDPARWGGAVPGAGGAAVFSEDASYEVSFPEGTYANPAQFSFLAAAGRTLAVKGVGTTFAQPTLDAAAGAYTKEPIQFRCGDRKIFDLESWWDGVSTAAGPFTLRDFAWRLVNRDGTDGDELHFDAGDYNFYDPEGVPRAFRHAFFMTASDAEQKVVFHRGAQARLAGAAWIGNGRCNTLRFEGGVHSLNGVVNFNYKNNNAPDTTNRVEVVDGASLAVNATGDGAGVGFPGLPERRFEFRVEGEGSTLTAGGTSWNDVQGGVSRYWLADGAAFVCGTENGARFGSAAVDLAVRARDAAFRVASGGATFAGGARVEMTGGVFRTAAGAGTVSLEGGAAFALNGTALDLRAAQVLRCGTFAATNATGWVSNFVVGASSASADAASVVVLAGGAVTNDGMLVVGDQRPGTLAVTGGCHVFRGETDTALRGTLASNFATSGSFGNYSTGTFAVSGDETEVEMPLSEGYFGNGEGSVGRLLVDGGCTTLGKAGGVTYLASLAAARAEVRVAGGVLTMPGTVSCPRGTVDWLQTGGACSVSRIAMASFPGGAATSTQTVAVAGGAASVETLSLCGNGPTPCVVALTGGVLEVGTVSIGAGAAGRGGTGSATLVADGGTLRARRASAALLADFDVADVRGGGLTIETDVDVTVPQAFTNLSAAATSRIVKRGRGTLTLTGAYDPSIAVVVEGGLVRFGVSGTIGGLTLGGADGAGGIDLADGVALNVKGDVVVLRDGSRREFSFPRDAETGLARVAADDTEGRTLEIRLDAGTSNATDRLSFRVQDTLRATVAKDARLLLDGACAHGAFVKAGDGAAVLSSPDNAFRAGVTLERGLLGVSSMAALGADFSSVELLQKGGTLALPAGELRADYAADTGSATGAFVIKADGDVTVRRPFVNRGGALVKRGAGTLRFETGVDFATGEGQGAHTRTPLVFDANGTPPETGYAGFNVVEGEVVLADASYRIDRCAHVGLRTAAAPAATPTLTFTNATVSLNGQKENMFFVGAGVAASDPAQTFRLNILDSSVSGNTPVCVGGYEACAARSATSRVEVVLRNATLTAGYGVWFNENKSGGVSRWTVDRSRIYGNRGSRSYGTMEVDFVNGSVYAYNSARTLANFPETRNAAAIDSGYFRFRSGSEAYLSRLGGQGGFFRTRLLFDGGVWHAGACPRLAHAEGYEPKGVRVVLEAGGVTMPVAEGATCRNTIRLEGAGGLVKTGAGELAFDTRATWDDWTDKANPVETKLTEALGGTATWSFTGPAAVREGVLSVAPGALDAAVAPQVDVAPGAVWRLGAGVVAAGATVTGGGAVKGGTLENLTLKAALDETGANTNAVPTLDAALAGCTVVDFGGTATLSARLPENVKVARFSGASPGAWKAVNLGVPQARGVFRLENGSVLCTVRRTGCFLLVR